MTSTPPDINPFTFNTPVSTPPLTGDEGLRMVRLIPADASHLSVFPPAWVVEGAGALEPTVNAALPDKASEHSLLSQKSDDLLHLLALFLRDHAETLEAQPVDGRTVGDERLADRLGAAIRLDQAAGPEPFWQDFVAALKPAPSSHAVALGEAEPELERITLMRQTLRAFFACTGLFNQHDALARMLQDRQMLWLHECGKIRG